MCLWILNIELGTFLHAGYVGWSFSPVFRSDVSRAWEVLFSKHAETFEIHENPQEYLVLVSRSQTNNITCLFERDRTTVIYNGALSQVSVVAAKQMLNLCANKSKYVS
jgi:hypothetical protein